MSPALGGCGATWAACLGASLAVCASAAAQRDPDWPLDNDTRVPSAALAAQRLAEGDELLARLRASGARDPAALVPILEAWRDALARSAPGDLVDAREPELRAAAGARAPRVWCAIEIAVEARLLSLGPDGARSCGARFEDSARGDLAAAGDDVERLEQVEHQNPFTEAAARAALRAADLALERADVARARAALARAAHRARLGPGLAPDFTAQLERAIAARRAALEGVAPPPATSGDWRALDRATSLTPRAAIATSASGLERHLRPDLAFDDGGTCWAQCGETLVAVAPDASARTWSIVELGAAGGLDWEPAFGEARYDWIQRPAVAQGSVVLVCGRATRDGRVKRDRGNALLGVRDGRLAWGYAEGQYVRHVAGAFERHAPFLPGRLEFQPGPVTLDGTLVVLVRQWDGPRGTAEERAVDESRTRVWIASLDARDGAPRAWRELAFGSDQRARARGRLEEPRGVACPAEPLALSDGRVLASTGLGVAVALEACSLRPIWALATRRATSDDAARRTGEPRPFAPTSPTSPTSRAPEASAAAEASSGAGWLWAPADGDGWVQCVSADLPRAGENALDPRRGPALRVPGLADLAGGGPDEIVALLYADGRDRLAAIDPRSGARRDALPVARGARVQALGLSPARAVCVAGGTVELLDRTRELARLQSQPVPDLEREGALGLGARGGRLVLAGVARVWIFDVGRP